MAIFLAIGCKYTNNLSSDAESSNAEIIEIFCDADTDSVPDFCMPKTSYIRFACKAGYKLNTDLSKLTISLNVTNFRRGTKMELFRNAIINTRVKNFKIQYFKIKLYLFTRTRP